MLSSLPEKFRKNIVIDTVTQCWEWQGDKSRNGYGRVYMHGAKQMAHRMTYRLLIGNIGNRHLDHLCCNRSCCNPAHLEKVTHKENCRRRDKRQGKSDV